MKPKHTKLEKIVDDARARVGTGKPLAIALHDYVRDEVAFGFTPYFDAASSEMTLKLGAGHCNPQARLMVELFKAAGFEARFRPSTITNDILNGVAITPPQLSHIFTEVRMGDNWVRLDSYIADPPLRRAAIEKLEQDNLDYGLGCHRTATGEWDGTHDAFSQIADPDMIVELHDPVEDIESFYRSDAYKHRMGPLSYNLMFAPGRILPSLAMASLNRRANALRSGAALHRY